ncbi:MAG: hypothetical protein WC612_00165 [Bdellovibrionales bacterium]|jgi:hypothetical protein
MTKKVLTGFLFAVVLLTASYVFACGEEGNTPEKLAKRQSEDFARKDVDHDNLLSFSEFSTFQDWEMGGQKDHAVFFRALDKDASGSLTFDEWQVGFPLKGYMTKGGC